MSLDSIINVEISRETAAVTQAGFGTALVLGPNAPAGVNTYSSLTAMAEDFDTTDPEYKMAAKVFGQTPRVTTIKTFPMILDARIVTFTPDVTVQSAAPYTVEIDGVEYTFTSDADPTAGEIVTGLSALINADADCPVAATGTNTLILTEKVAGTGFTHDYGTANMDDMVVTNAGYSVADALAEAIEEDNDFYFVLITSESKALSVAMAAQVEPLMKIFIARSDDSDVRTNATDDVASVLKDASYFRTGIFYTGTPADYGDSAFVGRLAPYDPGSETWAYKTLAGVTVDAWTETEQGYLNAKNVNHYLRIGGVNTTLNGKVAGGEYIDVIRFIDWIKARMQERLFGDLVRNTKIPYTDRGIGIIEAGMRAVLEAGIAAGGLVSYTVTVPKASAVSDNDKAQRVLRNCSFTAVLAGAIHAVEISGNVTL